MLLDLVNFLKKSLLEHVSHADRQGLTVIVGVSGGPDSVALLHGLYLLKSHLPFLTIEAAHVNYGLRGAESDADTKLVAELCDLWGLPLNIRHLSSAEAQRIKEKNTQERARQLRRRYFEELGNRCVGPAWVALAHHQDDVAENFLFRISRGLSHGDAGGLLKWHRGFWRPMLNLSKRQLGNYLLGQKLPFRLDSTNDTLLYSRNIIRHQCLSALEQVNSNSALHIARAAQEMQDMSEYLLSLHKEDLARLSSGGLSVKRCVELPEGLLRLLLVRTAARFNVKKLTSRLFSEVVTALPNAVNETWDMGEGVCLKLQQGKILMKHLPHETARYRQHHRTFVPTEVPSFKAPGITFV